MTGSSNIYLAAVDRVARRVQSWSAAEAATAIPSCPQWSAHDLVAHLAGGAADHAAGRLDGFPGPGWTNRHIAERSSRPTQEVLAELLALAPRTAAACDQRSAGPNSSWDAYIHERDLAEAFDGEVRTLDEDGCHLLGQFMAFLGAGAPYETSCVRSGDTVEFTVLDRQRYRTTVPAATAFRAVSGRTEPADIESWPWVPTAPPPPVLQSLQLF
ncbi:maleylpyruvate isomerase N-terminal domain-containing protein [uncultured Jatrophihabitans sp.]|uniref:maleylpyruvate isomerase N-terminal domain-containing protein n=1 Tax=uncultured Jatrophihabitans sp. TaxID=1610747 RepID=UPI0035CB4800